MKKKFLLALYLALILVIAVVLRGMFDNNSSKTAIEDALIKSMDSAKAQVIESTISAWAQVNNQFLTEEQLAAEVTEVLNIIKPEKSTINIIEESNANINKQTVHASDGNKHYNIAVESIKTEKGGETYTIMDIFIDSSSIELTSERQKLEQYFSGRSKRPEISSCVIGVYNGKLDEGEMQTKVKDALSSVKAKQVEALNTKDISSISAFSGNINNFILSNNKKINMQIATRYSSYDDKTYIWIGSPLIHVEY